MTQPSSYNYFCSNGLKCREDLTAAVSSSILDQVNYSRKQGKAVNELRDVSPSTSIYVAIDKFEALGIVCKRVVYPSSKIAQLRMKSRATIAIMSRYNSHNYDIDQYDVEPDDDMLIVFLQLIATIMNEVNVNSISLFDLREYLGLSKGNFLFLRQRLSVQGYWLVRYRLRTNMRDESLDEWTFQSLNELPSVSRLGHATLRTFGGVIDQAVRFLYKTSDGVTSYGLRDAFGISRKRCEKIFATLLQEFNLISTVVQAGKATVQKAVPADYLNNSYSFDSIVDKLYGYIVESVQTNSTVCNNLEIYDGSDDDNEVLAYFQAQNSKVSSQRLDRLNFIKSALCQVAY